MSSSGGSQGAQRVAQFITTLGENDIQIKDLAVRINNPIVFRPPGGGKPAYGYEATIGGANFHIRHGTILASIRALRVGLVNTSESSSLRPL